MEYLGASSRMKDPVPGSQERVYTASSPVSLSADSPATITGTPERSAVTNRRSIPSYRSPTPPRGQVTVRPSTSVSM